MPPDKRLHLLVSMGLVWLAYAILIWCRYRRFDNGPISSDWGIILWSTLIAFCLGLLKELNDYLGIFVDGTADAFDILANFYGVLVGFAGLVLLQTVRPYVPCAQRIVDEGEQLRQAVTPATTTRNHSMTVASSHREDEVELQSRAVDP